MDLLESYELNLNEIIDAGDFELSTILPSEWNEQNRSMDSSVSRYKGKFSYDISPYTREIVDCLSQNHPARTIAVMKGAQVGFSTGVIEAGVGWIISQAPGNILFLTGHSDLSEEAILKVDNMIDSCGIRHLIRPSVQRRRATKTGDTNTKKEFPGGSLVSGSAGNHKLLRQRSVMYGFIDDFDAAKQSTKESGSTTKMIEQRFASYEDKMKLFYISTPELKESSNIEPVFLLGDQRRYHVPCPDCGDMIAYHWSIDIEGSDGKEKGGITWKLDKNNKLINNSVGYICQSCGSFFDDKNKYEQNLSGVWIPTAKPIHEGYYSYHLSSLYAPPGMYGWLHYVRQYLEANPPGESQKEHLHKTFVNLCLGETYEPKSKQIEASTLQKNIRNYNINELPETLSEQDGNGMIVLLTCACDLNGNEDDARLDYEVLAWTESGSSYSIDHGSIGTFIPREGNKKNKVDRKKWTYKHNQENSVWPEFDKVLDRIYVTDTERRMKVFISGVDCGYHTNYAYHYIDNSNFNIVGLKGKDVDKYISLGVDLPTFKPARERANLYLVEGNKIKDELADLIGLKWNTVDDASQPVGFLNYPIPSGGKYLFQNYFSHYESEHRVLEMKDNQAPRIRWKKKQSNSQNHMWDVRVYNMVLRDIMVDMVCKELKMKHYVWKDFVDVLLQRS